MTDAVMGELVPYRSPRAHADRTSRLGMVIFLASWAMLFAALFFVYGMIRARADVWPPAGAPRLPIALPALATVVLASSSAALVRSLALLERGRVRSASLALGAALVLGTVFLVVQTTVWRSVHAAGLEPATGPYGSAFYSLTGLHAAHVVVGLVALAALVIGALRGSYGPARLLPIRLWAMYWHFVGVVWLLLYVTVYLV
ncbi:MAG: heme-copper oxidase subunit III [Deltaproteobacteria bacterium]|nr:heme-copper oxidase subunit III [Deltaproteobacteria bacterium]